MLHILEHAFIHAIEHSINLIPYLIVTYLLMEYIEHKTTNNTLTVLKKTKAGGPLIGGMAGILPQCGMSAMASNFYTGRVISVGTLVAVFLSTSDEMLPLLLSNAVEIDKIAGILCLKVIIAVVVGVFVDIIYKNAFKKEEDNIKIHEMCEHEHCNCEKGIVRSALIHTVHIFLFVVIFTFLINIGIEIVGEDNISGFILNSPILGPVLSAVIGLIPNCAASVVITQMYLDGLMGFGTMMSGLLAGAGVGILVLFKVNENKKENIAIISILYLTGVVSGIILNMV